MSQQSVSQRLQDQLRRIISNTPPGGRLPSEPELAKQLGVSRATLRESMRTFETQGLIRRRQGSGTFVSHPSQVIESGLEVLESIETLAKRIGLQVSLGDWSAKVHPANEDAESLGVSPDTEVITIERVIHAEGRPVAFLIDTLPGDILTHQELEAGFTGSVLDLLLRRGTPALQSSRSEINAVTASHDMARAFGIQRGDVLLRFNARLFDTDNRVVDHSYSYFLPGYFRFHVVRRIGQS